MDIPTDLKGLAALFSKLGADEAESWAGSQIRERIPQLHRFLFLRQAWAHITRHDDVAWMDAEMNAAKKEPDVPFAGLGHALKRVLEAGAERQDITDIVRCCEARMLFNLCCLLDDPGLEENLQELEGFGWGLFATDEDGAPAGQQIEGLHESVLETDPTGLEMCPARN